MMLSTGTHLMNVCTHQHLPYQPIFTLCPFLSLTSSTYTLQLYSIAVAPNHTRRTTVGRTPRDEGSVRRRDLYLTTHNIHKRQTSMSPAGFERAIPASERPQTHVLDHAAHRHRLCYVLREEILHLR